MILLKKVTLLILENMKRKNLWIAKSYLTIIINQFKKTTSTDDISNITNENNISLNESKSSSKSLSETGKQSNYGLISIVASILFAAGSLIAYGRVSKFN